MEIITTEKCGNMSINLFAQHVIIAYDNIEMKFLAGKNGLRTVQYVITYNQTQAGDWTL